MATAPTNPVVITIEFARPPGSDGPVEGLVRTPAGASERFAGWTGLVALIETLLAGERQGHTVVPASPSG